LPAPPPPPRVAADVLQRTVFPDSVAGLYPETERLRGSIAKPLPPEALKAASTPQWLVKPVKSAPLPPIVSVPTTPPPSPPRSQMVASSSPAASGHGGGIAAQQVAILTGHTAPVIASAFGPYGVCLATAGLDHAVRVWQLDAAAPKQRCEFIDQRLDEIRAILF